MSAPNKLNDLLNHLSKIKIPICDKMREEAFKIHRDIIFFARSISDGTLKTRLAIDLPYPISKNPLEVHFKWLGIDVIQRAKSNFLSPQGLFIQAAPPEVAIPQKSTRWQYGTTQIEFEISALIDPSIQVPPLQMHTLGTPFDGWPNGLHVAFSLVHFSSWALNGRPEYIGPWVPAPGDICAIRSVFDVPGVPNFDFKLRTNASMSWSSLTPSADIIQIELGDAKTIAWHQQCRFLADQYAVLGEVREAIFWLNVGVESLLRTRMESHIQTNGLNLNLEILDGGKTYWDEAKQLIAAKFPEIVDEIAWPTEGKKPSLFQQLKYFCAHVEGAPEFDVSKKHYSKVSRRRNALFHGLKEDAVPTKEVRSAMDSFDWLAANFCAA
jgi:hypothetical protein